MFTTRRSEGGTVLDGEEEVRPEQCHCDKEIAHCSLKKLTSVPSCDDCSSILYLDLSDNLITELTDNAFTDYPNLKQIDIERNQIHTIDTRAFEGLGQLVKNTIDRNNFTDIDPDPFMDNTLFTSLSLRDNPLVISPPFLASDTLTVLDLSGCGLKILPKDTFEHLTQLEKIMLTNNDLEELPELPCGFRTETEGRLRRGRRFPITNALVLATMLICLPINANACDLNGSSNLYCKSLGLNGIPENKFGEEIKMFELTGNKLHKLGNVCFSQYSSLTSLYLRSNDIADVASNAFEGLNKLRTLVLSDNKITSLYPDTFQGNTKLTALSLKSNPLELSTPFLNSDSINYLELTKCNLTTLHADSFVGIKNLETLILKHNRLEYLPMDLFKNLPKLKKIYLQGNPWRCGGAMEELMASKQDVIADYKKMQCVTLNGEQQVWSQGGWRPAATGINSVVPDDEPKQAVEMIAAPAMLVMRKEDSLNIMEVTTEGSDEEYDNDEDEENGENVVNDENFENVDNVESDEQVSQEIRSILALVNIGLIVLISLLCLVVVVILLRRYGVFKICQTSTVESSYDNREYDADECNGYLIPRTVAFSALAKRNDSLQNIHIHHIYESIK